MIPIKGFNMKLDKKLVSGWVEINEAFIDTGQYRLIRVQGAIHQTREGLPLLQVDYVALTDESYPPRAQYGENIPVAEAKAIVEAFPDRRDNPTFYDLIADLL